GYRMTPLGGQSKPSEPSIQELNVKSFITSPAGEHQVKAGVVYVTGVAFSGGQPIRRVEISSDGGRNWIEAPFVGLDLGRFAWRHFAMPLRMSAGNYVLVSRATDGAGNVQPEQRLENAHGYSNNSWKDPAVLLTVVGGARRYRLRDERSLLPAALRSRSSPRASPAVRTTA